MPPRNPGPIMAPESRPFRLTAELVSVLIAVALQAVAIIIWGAKMDARVKALEERPDTSETVARLDERTSSIAKGVERLEQRLLDADRR